MPTWPGRVEPIRVAVRVRPLKHCSEPGCKKSDLRLVWHVEHEPESGRQSICLVEEVSRRALSSNNGRWRSSSTNNLETPKRRLEAACFNFDLCFDGAAPNGEVFATAAQGVLRSALSGVHATVLAYGQTNSGKTHSILGTPGDPGILPRALRDIFDGNSDTGPQITDFAVRLSYFEVFNESVNDLLTRPSEGTRLPVKEDADKGFYVQGLSELPVSSAEEALALIRRGEERRRYAQTRWNWHSSRSHVLFTLILESLVSSTSGSCGRPSVVGTPAAQGHISKVNIVDLAGCENQKMEQSEDGRYINRSLFFLGVVISKLCSGSWRHGASHADRSLTPSARDHRSPSCRRTASSSRQSRLGQCSRPGERTPTRPNAPEFTEAATASQEERPCPPIGYSSRRASRSSSRGPGDVQDFIPYRDSKLTRILRSSLGGNAVTCLLVTVHPALCYADQSLMALRFASKAQSVVNYVTVPSEATKSRERTMPSAINVQTHRNTGLQSQLRSLRRSKENLIMHNTPEVREEDIKNLLNHKLGKLLDIVARKPASSAASPQRRTPIRCESTRSSSPFRARALEESRESAQSLDANCEHPTVVEVEKVEGASGLAQEITGLAELLTEGRLDMALVDEVRAMRAEIQSKEKQLMEKNRLLSEREEQLAELQQYIGRAGSVEAKCEVVAETSAGRKDQDRCMAMAESLPNLSCMSPPSPALDSPSKPVVNSPSKFVATQLAGVQASSPPKNIDSADEGAGFDLPVVNLSPQPLQPKVDPCRALESTGKDPATEDALVQTQTIDLTALRCKLQQKRQEQYLHLQQHQQQKHNEQEHQQERIDGLPKAFAPSMHEDKQHTLSTAFGLVEGLGSRAASGYPAESERCTQSSGPIPSWCQLKTDCMPEQHHVGGSESLNEIDKEPPQHQDLHAQRHFDGLRPGIEVPEHEREALPTPLQPPLQFQGSGCVTQHCEYPQTSNSSPRKDPTSEADQRESFNQAIKEEHAEPVQHQHRRIQDNLHSQHGDLQQSPQQYQHQLQYQQNFQLHLRQQPEDPSHKPQQSCRHVMKQTGQTQLAQGGHQLQHEELQHQSQVECCHHHPPQNELFNSGLSRFEDITCLRSSQRCVRRGMGAQHLTSEFDGPASQSKVVGQHLYDAAPPRINVNGGFDPELCKSSQLSEIRSLELRGPHDPMPKEDTKTGMECDVRASLISNVNCPDVPSDSVFNRTRSRDAHQRDLPDHEANEPFSIQARVDSLLASPDGHRVVSQMQEVHGRFTSAGDVPPLWSREAPGKHAPPPSNPLVARTPRTGERILEASLPRDLTMPACDFSEAQSIQDWVDSLFANPDDSGAE
eukprot:gnl/MRDRNA2_/MRDRNA2_60884_c0_seq2.p1 gnl/MRDRNA2_/MRDRNA2_60884_c0~~gnl/MRDRNA2_/MRDRNA2_60884_c0_seq2.p1  ORF type:complete len:1337 (+),score=228.90 gnl/MRDRNA2_/MRDRNA2_60884_c0_seq2:71-4081(+)